MRALDGSFSFGVRTGDLAATIPARLGSGSMSMGGQVGRTNGVREMPVDEQPRERMLRWGSAQLKTSELIAILLNTGTEGETVIKLSERILNEYGGLRGLTRLDLVELTAIHGVGPAKATRLRAALELANRVVALIRTIESGSARRKT